MYYYFAEKNWLIRQEYEPYVEEHKEEHAKQPWKHWWILIRLNWHYRVLRKNNILYYEMPKTQERFPYMEGAESELYKRPLSVHLAMQLLPYDVISFDIFDTLIFRPFSKPVELFHIIGKRLNMPEFYRRRIETEKRLKELATRKTGSREITIEDIYTELEKETGLPKEIGIQTEFGVELQYCIPNPYMKQVYQMMKEQKKIIIIVSDMYLPQKMMTILLEKNGYTGYDNLYVSCDYKCGKGSKGLYKYVLKDYSGKKIIHIGDNPKADINCAESCGIKTIFYKNINEVGNPYRAGGMSELVGGAYKGIVNNHLHNGTKKYNVYYEYGFVYGGIYIFGFCNWIYEKAKRERIEKILFLARDGDIYKKIMEKFFPDLTCEYFLWSRIANSKYTFEKKRLSAFENSINSRIRSKNPHTVEGLLKVLGLSELKDYISKYNLREDVLVIEETVPNLKRFFLEHHEEIESIYQMEKKYVKQYIKEKVGTAKKIAVVDVGWVGNGPMGIKYLIEEEMRMDCQVKCWLAAAVSSNEVNISANQQDGTIESYLFSDIHNKNYYDAFLKTNKGLNHMFFEMFTQAISPSYVGMDKEGSFEFQEAEVENYTFIRSIHQGIADFCERFYQYFKNDSYMYWISGADAFAPFRFAIRNIYYFKKNFPDFVFSKVVGMEQEKEITITMGNRISDAGYKEV